MKLFTRKDLAEGEAHPRDAFIAYGNSLTKYRDSDFQTVAEWEQVKGKDKTDGWYVKIEFPFTRNMLHINPNTFDREDGPVRYMIRFRYRPANQRRGSVKYLSRGWFPV